MDNSAKHAPPDPVQLIRLFDADAIRRRLAEMARERRSLLTLLRAALAVRPPERKGVADVR